MLREAFRYGNRVDETSSIFEEYWNLDINRWMWQFVEAIVIVIIQS